MERVAFIHGSSGGQSAFVPSDLYTKICNDVAGKYFKGRSLRQKESQVSLALFVEVYNDADDVYILYSFVNNSCLGPNGREGQYLAISILCKDLYAYPEDVYNMLCEAYTQLKNAKHIIKDNPDGKAQYVIAQFSEQKSFLTNFLHKVEDFFDIKNVGNGKIVDKHLCPANYDTWNGEKISIEMSNSVSSFNSLAKNGRIYISEEYGSSSQQIKILQQQLDIVKLEKQEIEKSREQDRLAERTRVKNELFDLSRQVESKNEEISRLTNKLDEYQKTIQVVDSELKKIAQLGENITNPNKQISENKSNNKKDILKISLLFVLLFLVLLNGIANFLFFRNFSPLPKQDTCEIKEIGSTLGQNAITPRIESPQEMVEETNIIKPNEFTVSPKESEVSAKGGNIIISVKSDQSWEFHNNNKELKFDKGESSLTVKVPTNLLEEAKKFYFNIKSGQDEEQIIINQAGNAKKVNENKADEGTPNYVIIVKDAQKQKLSPNSEVEKGQKLTAEIQNPGGDECAWHYDNCDGPKNKNHREVNITVGDKAGNVVISYGKNSQQQRTKFYLKVKEAPQKSSEENQNKNAVGTTEGTSNN